MVAATTFSFRQGVLDQAPAAGDPWQHMARGLRRLLAALGLAELSAAVMGTIMGMPISFSDARGPMLAKRPNEVEDEDELDDEEEDEEDDDLDDDEDDFEDDEEFEEEFGEDELEDDDDDIFYDDDDDE